MDTARLELADRIHQGQMESKYLLLLLCCVRFLPYEIHYTKAFLLCLNTTDSNLKSCQSS